jgi:hypothetical protein
MEVFDLEKVVPAWIELQKTADDSPHYDELFWSVEMLYNLVAGHPELAFAAILSILKADQSNTTYENLSAGPLENLLSSHGQAVIDRIEKEAATNPNFRRLLGGVWKNGIDDAIWQRVQGCRDRRGWDGIPE